MPMGVSLHAADLHYGGGLVLHTASSGSVRQLSEIYLRVERGSYAGVGAVRINIAYLNGLAPQAVIDEAVSAIAAIDWSRAPAELLGDEAWRQSCSAAVQSLIDIALHDLLARQQQQCVAAMLGAPVGKDGVSSTTNQTLFWSSYDDLLASAARYIERGFRKLKVRIGIGDFDEDCRRIAALRQRFGTDIEIAADANGAWQPDAAIERLTKLAAFRLAYVEQPVAAGDWDCLAILASKSPVPIMLDESIATELDLARVCQFGGRLLAHLKLVKLGGISPTMAAARRLSAAGVPFMIGQMNEGGVCTAAALHVAYATKPAYAELYGADGLIDDSADGVSYRDGLVSIAAQAGLGVTFDTNRTKLIREFN